MGAALIAAFACPAQPAVLVDRRPGEVRTTVVACDGDRRVVLKRARLRRGLGSRVVDVSGPGRLVGWVELRYARGRVRGLVRVTHLDAGRVRLRPATDWRRVPPRLEIAVPASGEEFAWRVGRVVYHTWGDQFRNLLDDDAIGPLVLEDGFTARWLSDDGILRFEDLGRPSRCDGRSRYRAIARSDRVVVTSADYPTARADRVVRVVRACILNDAGHPLDTDIAQAWTDPRSDRALEVAGIRDEWVVLNRVTPTHGGRCGSVTVEVYRAVFGRPARLAASLGCERAPGPTTPLVVTGSGAPAWIVESGGTSTLLTAAGRGAIVLDEAGAGALTGLAAEGTRVRWLHAGESRSMDLG